MTFNTALYYFDADYSNIVNVRSTASGLAERLEDALELMRKAADMTLNVADRANAEFEAECLVVNIANMLRSSPVEMPFTGDEVEDEAPLQGVVGVHHLPSKAEAL